MGAPTKEGLDYFSFDVDLLDNDDLDFLRERYGVVVNDVYIALLTLLYRKKGYYIPYETEAERKDCIWYIYKRVRGGKYPVQQELIPTVIEAIVAQRLFDRDHFNKIITSERAQKTYYKATVERKFESFDIRPEYWLLSDETMRKLSKTHPYYLFLHPESKSDEKRDKSDDYQSKSTEKPSKKSKVNITSNEVNNIHSNTHENDFEFLECEKLLQIVQEECPVIFNRHQAKVDKGNLQIVREVTQILEQLQGQYSYEQLKEIFRKANKIFCIKPSYSNCDIKWVLNNIQRVLSEEDMESLERSATSNKKSCKQTAREQTTDILKNLFNEYRSEENNGDT